MNINDQYDMHGRAFDDVIFYYGVEEVALIDEDILRNHLFKAREKGKIPKGGLYCTPKELFKLIGDTGHLLNINFRNVQYIENFETKQLYWIYCLSKSNLYDFKFVGLNMTEGILDLIMDHTGFKLGFMRYSEDMKEIQVWYNPETLYMLVFHMRNGKIYNKMAYFKRFDAQVQQTTNTSCVFEDYSHYNVPLVDMNKYDNNWTSIINVMSEQEVQNRKHNISVFDIERGLENSPIIQEDYDEMLRLLFNKK